MFSLFKYNWQVRDEWFEWSKQLTHEDLIKKRTGGVQSFLETFLHIVDVEYSWIMVLKGKEDRSHTIEEFSSLKEVKKLSDSYRQEIEDFLLNPPKDFESQFFTPPWLPDNSFRGNDIIPHLVAHEIHHIGQLSVWARELGLKPISANYIGRKF